MDWLKHRLWSSAARTALIFIMVSATFVGFLGWQVLPGATWEMVLIADAGAFAGWLLAALTYGWEV